MRGFKSWKLLTMTTELVEDILQLNDETNEKIWEIHYNNITIQADFTDDDSCDHGDSEEPKKMSWVPKRKSSAKMG